MKYIKDALTCFVTLVFSFFLFGLVLSLFFSFVGWKWDFHWLTWFLDSPEFLRMTGLMFGVVSLVVAFAVNKPLEG